MWGLKIMNIQPSGKNHVDISLVSRPEIMHHVKIYGSIKGWFASVIGVTEKIYDIRGQSYYISIRSLGKNWTLLQHSFSEQENAKNVSERIRTLISDRKAGKQFIKLVAEFQKTEVVFWETCFKSLYSKMKDWQATLFLQAALTEIDIKKIQKFLDVEKTYNTLKQKFLSADPENKQLKTIFSADTFQDKRKILISLHQQLLLEQIKHPFPTEVDI